MNKILQQKNFDDLVKIWVIPENFKFINEIEVYYRDIFKIIIYWKNIDINDVSIWFLSGIKHLSDDKMKDIKVIAKMQELGYINSKENIVLDEIPQQTTIYEILVRANWDSSFEYNYLHQEKSSVNNFLALFHLFIFKFIYKDNNWNILSLVELEDCFEYQYRMQTWSKREDRIVKTRSFINSIWLWYLDIKNVNLIIEIISESPVFRYLQIPNLKENWLNHSSKWIFATCWSYILNDKFDNLFTSDFKLKHTDYNNFQWIKSYIEISLKEAGLLKENWILNQEKLMEIQNNKMNPYEFYGVKDYERFLMPNSKD